VTGTIAAVGLGIFGAAADAVAGTVGLVDTGANLLLSGLDNEVGRRAQEDLADTLNTVTFVVENSDKIGSQLVEGAVETVKGVAEGDLGAITRFTSFATSVVVPAGGPRALAAQTARTATTVAQATAATGRAVVKTGRAAVQATKRAASASLRVTRNTAAAGARAARRTLVSAANTSRRSASAALQKAKRVFQRKRGAIDGECFVAGTLVATLSGLVPIEDVQVGDLVWSRNETTGETQLREVVQLFETADQAIYEVDVETASGEVETLGTGAPLLGGRSRLGPGESLAGRRRADLEHGRHAEGSAGAWVASAGDGLQLRGRWGSYVLCWGVGGLGP
jgi:hypothetical protein